MSLNRQRLCKGTAVSHLSKMGLDMDHIERALNVYEHNYPIYNVAILKEIVCRISIKDKVKALEQSMPPDSMIYYSRVNVKQALESHLNFSEYEIDKALKQYENMQSSSDTRYYHLADLISIIIQDRAECKYPYRMHHTMSTSASSGIDHSDHIVQQLDRQQDHDPQPQDEEEEAATHTNAQQPRIGKRCKRPPAARTKPAIMYKHAHTPNNTDVTYSIARHSTSSKAQTQSHMQVNLTPNLVILHDEEDHTTSTSTNNTNNKRESNASTLHNMQMIKKISVYDTNEAAVPHSALGNDDDAEEDDDDDEIHAHSTYDMIIKELMRTEESYHTALQTLFYDVLIPMFENGYVDKARYYTKITSSIPLILRFHTYLLEELMSAYRRNISIIGVFNKIINLNRDEFVNIYLKYVTDYADILDLIGNLSHRNKHLNAFFKEKRKQKTPITNYLIMPIQRITNYVLLLENLQQHTSGTHAEYEDVENALNMMLEISEHINDEQKRIENKTHSLHVQSRLSGLKSPIIDTSNHRWFLDQFMVYKKEGNRLRQWFVFNNLLVIANKKNQCKLQLKLTECEITTTGSDANPLTFTLITSETKPTEYVAKSKHDLIQIQRLIKQQCV